MNDPIGREEFNHLVAHVKRIEQATEPIELKIVRGLPVPEATLLQNIMDQVGKQGPDIAQLKVDVGAIKIRLDEQGKMLREILARLPEKGE